MGQGLHEDIGVLFLPEGAIVDVGRDAVNSQSWLILALSGRCSQLESCYNVNCEQEMKSRNTTRFQTDSIEPSYYRLAAVGILSERTGTALQMLRQCTVCPRRCGVNRLENKPGNCGIGRLARVVSAFPHHGEENCLKGTRGSGTIFFGGCNLHCVFCQNHDISQCPAGEECTPDKIADLMLALQELGCHNINFVTPSHVLPQMLEGIQRAMNEGLHIPIVYNSSGYDSVEALRLLDGIVDIYMPDMKYWESSTAGFLSGATDYPQCVREAILEMHRQVGPLCFDSDGIATRGVLVRHLVLPGFVHESVRIFEWLAREVSPDTYVNLMTHYRPTYQVGRKTATEILFSEINRSLTHEEMRQVLGAARESGLWRFDGDL